MDYEEVIDNLNLISSVIPDYSEGRSRGLTDEESEMLAFEAVLQAVDILEKQIPKMSETQETYKSDIETKQLKIIDHYGMDKQLDQLIEESSELIKAICKYKRHGRGDSTIDLLIDLIEELADVKNLIEQIELDSDYIKDGIKQLKEYKIDRELQRIKRSEE